MAFLASSTMRVGGRGDKELITVFQIFDADLVYTYIYIKEMTLVQICSSSIADFKRN